MDKGVTENMKMKNIFLAMCLVSASEAVSSGVQKSKAVCQKTQKALLEVAIAVLKNGDNVHKLRAWNRVCEEAGKSFILVRRDHHTEEQRFEVRGVSHENAGAFCYNFNGILAASGRDGRRFGDFKKTAETELKGMFGLPLKKDLCVETLQERLALLKRTK